ncbi:MAG: CPBP family intramembrane metalloprotease [Anaerolineaceae bacterium]|nr:CPBP family intramembrane metalloprotease [Anaerolineaceae bacterium]
MKKLYEKNEVLFAVLWILVYCFVLVPIRGNFGDESIWMTLALFLFAVGITVFVKSNHLEEKYGLNGWPKNPRRFLYFIPMWIIVTGNLWGGVSPAHKGTAQLFAVLSMALVGYVEELIFRGFLLKALIPKNGITTAVIISAVTFGMGHIVNLLTGQGNLETIVQIIFAVSLGFLFTMVFYKSGSLLPCIVAHSLIDVFSKFSVDSPTADWIYVIATIILAIAYSAYLCRLKD